MMYRITRSLPLIVGARTNIRMARIMSRGMSKMSMFCCPTSIIASNASEKRLMLFIWGSKRGRWTGGTGMLFMIFFFFLVYEICGFVFFPFFGGKNENSFFFVLLVILGWRFDWNLYFFIRLKEGGITDESSIEKKSWNICVSEKNQSLDKWICTKDWSINEQLKEKKKIEKEECGRLNYTLNFIEKRKK